MKINISFYLLFITSMVFSQDNTITWYLKPSLSMESLFSKFENKENPILEAIRANGVNIHSSEVFTNKALDFAIALEADFDSYSLEFAFKKEAIGLSLSYKDPNLAMSTGGESLTEWSRIDRWEFSFIKPIKTVSIKRKHRKDLKNVFDLEFKTGISYGHIPLLEGNGVPISYQIGISSAGSYIIKRDSWGANLGVNLAFYQETKRRFELGLYYHQGFSKQLKRDWETISGEKFMVFSRGSSVNLYASFPIVLFKTKG